MSDDGTNDDLEYASAGFVGLNNCGTAVGLLVVGRSGRRMLVELTRPQLHALKNMTEAYLETGDLK